MLPLQLYRIFDYQQRPNALAQTKGQNEQGQASSKENPTSELPEGVTVDRRVTPDRRLQNDRRAVVNQQHANLIDTRKAQGRRRSLGRRKTDFVNEDALQVHRPISIKG